MSATRAAPGHTEAADATPESGIVWIYHFKPDGTHELIPNQTVEQTLADPVGWTWVHLSLADTRCRAWISQNARLSEFAREILLGPEEHMRMDLLGHEIVGVVPDLQQEIARATDAIVRLRFVMTDRLIISARRTPLHSVETVRRAVEAGKRFPTPVSFLDAVIDQFADAVGRMAEELGNELDNIEDRVMHGGSADERPRVGRVRLQAVRVHRHLAQLRSMFHRVEHRMASDNAPVAQTIRALAQKLDSIDHEVGSLHDRARLLIDEVAAKMTEITNRRLFTLSILTACLLPPTLVTGFFGMNTKDLPFQSTDGGTWWAFAIALLAGAVVYWALRRMRAF
ncbi:MAG TPA: transporter [Pseudolabrys sp.]|nr:transporter [Pseudolabrys sp.]